MEISESREPIPGLTIPCQAGIGLRKPYYQEVIRTLPALGFCEVHTENFFAEGGIAPAILEKIREHYPLSFHGVGLSLGSSSPLSSSHLKQLKRLVDRFTPAFVSEHVAWSSVDGVFLNDLLPLPYTEEALSVLVTHIDQMQSFLNRQILVENPSSYLQFCSSTIPEWEFMAEIVKRSGCALLLDINNIFVSCVNHGWNADTYLSSLPTASIVEYHLAGHARTETLYIDDHGGPVSDEVWELYKIALERIGPRPTLIEWDVALPPLATLLEQAEKANRYLYQLSGRDISSYGAHSLAASVY